MNTPTNINQATSEILGISHLLDSEQQGIRNALGEAILMRVMVAAHAELSEEDKATLTSISAEEDVQQFLIAHIPHLEELSRKEAERTIAEFKQQLTPA